MMNLKHLTYTSALWFALAAPASAAEPQLVFDRGLPQANLNMVSGENRSNIKWSLGPDGFLGDDFVIGAPGEHWVIDSIRTWAVPEIAVNSSKHLGDLFQDVRLYFGTTEGGLSPIASGRFTPGTDATDNSNISVTDATAAGAIPYDNLGTALRVSQLDFANLNRTVDGGTHYRFGVWGMGRAIPGQDSKTYLWFNHASNAAKAATTQDGADNTMLMFGTGGEFSGTFTSEGNGWDKASDVNIQVFAHRVGVRAGQTPTR